MFRVTSLTQMPEQQLNRWIKRIALLFVVVLIAFVAFYVFDRFRPAAPASTVDRNIVALEEAVRADPKDIASRGQLADAYLAKLRFDEAVVQYTAIVESGEDVQLAKLGRGQAYQQLGQLDMAKNDFQAVVDVAKDGEMANVDPGLQAAYYGLGTIALAESKPKDAIEPLTKAVTIARTDADALFSLGTAYLLTDDAAKAIEHLRRAVALVPYGWPEPYVRLAEAYAAQGDTQYAAWASAMASMTAGDLDAAESTLKTITSGDAAVDALIGLALIEEARGDTAAAAAWYEQALEKDPENVSAQMGLARVREITVPPSNHPALPSPAEGSN